MRVVILMLLSLVSFLTFSKDIPILKVYTYSSFISEWGPGETVKRLFELECHCKIKFYTFIDGVAMLNRLKLEANKDSYADIVLGLDNNLIFAAKQASLLQPHHIRPFKNRKLDWWDDYAIPYDYGYFTFVYNANNIKEPPNSMHELLDSSNQWKIVYQDPRTSTPGLGLILWIQSIYGENASRAWKKLARKTLTVTQSWSEAYNLMLNNEADFVLSYDTSPLAHMINENKFNYKATSFLEGHYGQIEVAGITKSSQHFKLAQRFLSFLATPKVQYSLATQNIMHPVIDIPLPKEFNKLIKITKMLELPGIEIEKNYKKWIASWRYNVS